MRGGWMGEGGLEARERARDGIHVLCEKRLFW